MPEILAGDNRTPGVGVITGSESDLPYMVPAFEVLEKYGVLFEVGIKSAHRTPDRMMEYARTASPRGLQVIIAAAGGSAHLPGMVASETTLPVIGVPVEQGAITGQNEAVGSMIRMPDGAPLVIVGPNKAKLAGEFAIRVLALRNPSLARAYAEKVKRMQQDVRRGDKKLNTVGYARFIEQRDLKKK